MRFIVTSYQRTHFVLDCFTYLKHKKLVIKYRRLKKLFYFIKQDTHHNEKKHLLNRSVSFVKMQMAFQTMNRQSIWNLYYPASNKLFFQLVFASLLTVDLAGWFEIGFKSWSFGMGHSGSYRGQLERTISLISSARHQQSDNLERKL